MNWVASPDRDLASPEQLVGILTRIDLYTERLVDNGNVEAVGNVVVVVVVVVVIVVVVNSIVIVVSIHSWYI